MNMTTGGRYQYFGWTVDGASGGDVALGRLVETHEHFHRQLDDTTAFGGLITTVAALAEACEGGRWRELRDALQPMSDLVHEVFAVSLSLLTTQRPLAPVEGFPAYDRHVATVQRLLGGDLHPWVALAAVRAAAMACMQSGALAAAASAGLDGFDWRSIPRLERPNHRLVALLESGFPDEVGAAHAAATAVHAEQDWWRGSPGVTLTPESMDGGPGAQSRELFDQLFASAAAALTDRAASVVAPGAHRSDLAVLVAGAQEHAPEGLVRIGAFVEAGGADLLSGGALDSQTITLPFAPRRASVLPYGSLSGLSGEGEQRHGFITLTRPARLRSSYALEGVALPDAPVVACLRSTVFDGSVRESLLLLVVPEPSAIDEGAAPLYVSITSSAAASAPDVAASWMAWADPSRLSLVLDTPATAALRRWCSDGKRFRTATQKITVDDCDVRIIAGRIEDDERQSALIVIPTTEFGARWFEAVAREDELLAAAVTYDADVFAREADQLDVVLNHLLFEEPVIGTGSWRQ